MSSKYRKPDGSLADFNMFKGESAYESAVIGGFSGTEEEFYEKLGQSVTKGELKVEVDKIDDEIVGIKEQIRDLREYIESKLSQFDEAIIKLSEMVEGI